MGVSTSEFGYTSAATGRRDHKVHKGHVVALVKKKSYGLLRSVAWYFVPEVSKKRAAFILRVITLNMKAVRSFAISCINYPTIRRDNPEDLLAPKESGFVISKTFQRCISASG
jgi:hypothetical protein